jgi:hypothetical protein
MASTRDPLENPMRALPNTEARQEFTHQWRRDARIPIGTAVETGVQRFQQSQRTDLGLNKRLKRLKHWYEPLVHSPKKVVPYETMRANKVGDESRHKVPEIDHPHVCKRKQTKGGKQK